MNARRMLWVLVLVALVPVVTANGQPHEMGTAFTYQGQLTDNGDPADGQYDFEFKLCDDPVAACVLASTTVEDHQVDEGLFTVEVDFGADVFNGEARWLELGVRPGASSGADPYTTLSPRQELTPTPHAFRAQTGVGGPDALNVTTDDKVGIGKDNPSEQLDVDGNIHASGTITSGSSITIDGVNDKIECPSTMELHVGGARAFRLEPLGPGPLDASPNLIGGCSDNSVTAGVNGATIGGGGLSLLLPNQVTADFGLVAGGAGNIASGAASTVSGGLYNVAGGYASFAAGYRAKVRDAAASGDADGDEGTFVWADSTEVDFTSTGPDQFLIRASGGVGIGKNNPAEQLDVDGNIHASGTITSGSSITIDGTPGSENINSTGDLDLQTGGTSRVFIESTGKVGIGTNSPGNVQLDVRTDSEIVAIRAENTKSSGTNYTMEVVADADGGDQAGVVARAHVNSTVGYYATGVAGSAHANESAGSEADAYGGKFYALADDYAFGARAYGRTDTDTAYGVYGHGAGSGTGTTAYGLYGTASGGETNWAGYFDGDVKATGTITSGGSITIDGVNDKIECPSTMELHVGGALDVQTGGTSRLFIESTGKVGIGTNSPGDVKLDVRTDSEFAAIYGENTKIRPAIFGIWGKAVGSGPGTGAYAIWGEAYGGETNYAGYFDGDGAVTGTMWKGGGSFKIDHPLDPENKYLYHSFIESPDMMNVYNGNVVLNRLGEATVEMPEWFEALNRDFRYQLTPIGAPGPNLYVAEEIHDNQFKIAGGKRGMKVSWQVTGIRQDAFANANRIPVEEVKPDRERGLYLHPEVYGMPRELGVGYEHQREAELARMAPERERAEREPAEHLPSEPQDLAGAEQEGGAR